MSGSVLSYPYQYISLCMEAKSTLEGDFLNKDDFINSDMLQSGSEQTLLGPLGRTRFFKARSAFSKQLCLCVLCLSSSSVCHTFYLYGKTFPF